MTIRDDVPPAFAAAPATWSSEGAGARGRSVAALVRRPGAVDVAALALLAAALAVCVQDSLHIDLRSATDVGIIGLLPASYWAALIVITAVFAGLLARWSTPEWLLGVGVVAVVVALFGVPAFASDVPRLNVTFRHAGIVENLVRTGSPDTAVDAYFSWPGFFMLGSLLSEVAGFASPLSLARTAPLYTNLAFLLPLVVIVRALTADRRRRWLTVWLYYLGQWANQDYFAPQSYTYFLYLCALGLALTFFSGPSGALSPSGVPTPRRRLRLPGRLRDFADVRDPLVPLPETSRGLVYVVVVVLVLATVPSHQLTPYAITVALVALAIAHGRPTWTLAAVAAVSTLAWLLFAATAYVDGHLSSMVGEFGDIGAATSANLGERLTGSPGHQLVVRVRLLLTAALALLAVLGVAKRLSRGYWDGTAVLLALVAYTLVPVQPYGGEMLLRCYFFSLPFVAFLAAGALLPVSGRSGSRRWVVPVSVVAVSALLLPALVVSRYGNARMDQFTPAEMTVVSRLYAQAKPGSYLFSVATNVPWKYQQYESHQYRSLDTMAPGSGGARDLAAHMTDLADATPAGGEFVVSRSQTAYLELFGGLDPGTVDAVEGELLTRYGWRLAYENADGRLYVSRRG